MLSGGRLKQQTLWPEAERGGESLSPPSCAVVLTAHQPGIKQKTQTKLQENRTNLGVPQNPGT